MLDDLAVDLENPKAHWNFGNEDFLGQICKIARRTLHMYTIIQQYTAQLLGQMPPPPQGRDAAATRTIYIYIYMGMSLSLSPLPVSHPHALDRTHRVQVAKRTLERYRLRLALRLGMSQNRLCCVDTDDVVTYVSCMVMYLDMSL